MNQQKTIQNLTYGKDELTVLVTELDNGKASVEYFINGYQVIDYGKIKPIFQNLFTSMADDVCKCLSLTKWTY